MVWWLWEYIDISSRDGLSIFYTNATDTIHLLIDVIFFLVKLIVHHQFITKSCAIGVCRHDYLISTVHLYLWKFTCWFRYFADRKGVGEKLVWYCSPILCLLAFIPHNQFLGKQEIAVLIIGYESPGSSNCFIQCGVHLLAKNLCFLVLAARLFSVFFCAKNSNSATRTAISFRQVGAS